MDRRQAAKKPLAWLVAALALCSPCCEPAADVSTFTERSRAPPSSVLIDPHGVILAAHLRGDELRHDLRRILDRAAK